MTESERAASIDSKSFFIERGELFTVHWNAGKTTEGLLAADETLVDFYLVLKTNPLY